MKLATKPLAGAASSPWERPSWRIRPSTMTPTRSARAAASSKSCVTRIVGSSELAEQRSELRPHRRLRVRVERGERLVEQQHRRVSRQRSGERDSLTLSTREVGWTSAGERGDPEALEQLPHAPPAAEADVRLDGQVREERVLLEDEPDRAPLRRERDPSLGIEPGLRTELDPARGRPEQSRDRAQDARLPRSGRPDERERLAPDLELYTEREGAKRVVEAEVERVHEGRSLTKRRMAALTMTSSAPIASARSKAMSNCS